MIRVSYITLCGFRGYKDSVRINFAPDFNVISGRNGVGKSTLCDALEFALTGTIDKYSDSKANGESVENYIWWRGSPPAKENYVEVGFIDDKAQTHVIRRSKDGKPPSLEDFSNLICNKINAPAAPLIQLCKASIIRDEFISKLSLDLNESERFQLLRDALGAPDSDSETHKANELNKFCSQRLSEIDNMREKARFAYKESTYRIEQIRSKVLEDTAIQAATKDLQNFLSLSLPTDQIISSARDILSKKKTLIENLEGFIFEFRRRSETKNKLMDLQEKNKILENISIYC